MKYIALDIRTTGPNKCVNQVLEIAMIVDSVTMQEPVDRLSRLHILVKHDSYTINAEQVRASELRRIVDLIELSNREGQTYDVAITKVLRWLKGTNCYIFAGRTEDVKFLGLEYSAVMEPRLAWLKPCDVDLPDLELCMARAGLSCPLNSSLDRAKATVKLMRRILREA
jgi:hypothetical protein